MTLIHRHASLQLELCTAHFTLTSNFILFLPIRVKSVATVTLLYKALASDSRGQGSNPAARPPKGWGTYVPCYPSVWEADSVTSAFYLPRGKGIVSGAQIRDSWLVGPSSWDRVAGSCWLLQSQNLNLPPVRAMRLSSSCHIPSGTDKYYYYTT